MNIDNIPLALLGKKPKENLSGKGRGDCWGKNRKKTLARKRLFLYNEINTLCSGAT
jgi:hypothetical protein